jgi:hypothetical protein
MAAFLVLLLSSCNRASDDDDGIVFWTPTPPPTQTERVVIHTTTPIYTYTPIVKIVTETPSPEYLCVTADENVYLRPSPGIDNYPITPLPNGTRLMTDLGGKKEEWIFVQYGELSGWVHQKYLEDCR